MDAYSTLNKADTAAVKSCFSTCQSIPADVSTSEALKSKRTFIDSLLKDISTDGEIWNQWDEETRYLSLLVLKTLSRVKEGSEAICEDQGITVLMSHAGLLHAVGGDATRLPPDTASAGREALKCLSNCLLQRGESIELFEENNGVEAIIKSMEQLEFGRDTTELVFLYARLLFLCTANRLRLVEEVVDRFNGIATIAKCLRQQISNAIQEQFQPAGMFTNSMAAGELFKVVFNIQHLYPESKVGCCSGDAYCGMTSFLPLALDFVKFHPLPTPCALAPPVSHAVHTLLTFSERPDLELWCPNKDLAVVERLLAILKQSLEYLFQGTGDCDEQGMENADDILPPILIILMRLAKNAEIAKAYLKNHCLPNEADRSLPVGKGASLSARLIRLMLVVRFPHIKETVSSLLFTLCDENGPEFVRCVGYGNAAGFLVSHNIPFTGSACPDPDSARPYNAVTGQYLDSAADIQKELASMTDEEKEMEAEKLFVLFERLKKNGFITTTNPIGEAIREGRI